MQTYPIPDPEPYTDYQGTLGVDLQNADGRVQLCLTEEGTCKALEPTIPGLISAAEFWKLGHQLDGGR